MTDPRHGQEISRSAVTPPQPAGAPIPPPPSNGFRFFTELWQDVARDAGWVPLAEVLDALRDEAGQQLARATDAPERAYARGVAYSSTFLARRFGEDR